MQLCYSMRVFSQRLSKALMLCRRPRGFGFIEFAYERDAEDAMNALDGKIWGGREITVPPLTCSSLLAVQTSRHYSHACLNMSFSKESA